MNDEVEERVQIIEETHHLRVEKRNGMQKSGSNDNRNQISVHYGERSGTQLVPVVRESMDGPDSQ